jgi:hypothetical protein
MAFKKILFRRDPAASWTSENPVLSAGEVGLETDTGRIKIGNGSSVWTALSYFVGNLPGATLDALGDVTITAASDGDFLRWNGTAWINDPVNLSTDTIGSYVESLVAGTGVSLLNNSGEGATPTVAIGQAVGTSSSVTFANVTADLVGNVTGNITGNAGTATTLQNARTIQITGDVSGSASFDGSGDINITSTVQPDSVALGTDTTGNYMSDVVAGTGVTVVHTPGESSSASIAIGQNVAASASVTFAAVNAPLVGNVTGNADTATALQSARTISLIGDVSGSVSFDGTSNAQITTAIQPNSIVLGTDTTGNYMESITNGTGIFLEHTLGEASQATISIGQAVGAGDTVTFAGVTADAIKIGVTNANTIDTTSGNLTIDSAGGTVTIDDNLSVTGTLTVSGSVAYVNTTNLQIGDNIITLNVDEDGSPSQNAGIEIERGTSTNVVLQYNETSDKWELTNDGSAYSTIETALTVLTSLNQRSALLDVWAVTNEALQNSPTYTAGTSDLNGGTGIGAKLTATTNGLLYVDNIPAGVNYRVLVKDQANPVHNGIYKVTAVGSASATWELTRSSDFDNSTLGQTIVGKTVRAAADGDVNEFQVFAVTSLGSQYLGEIPEMVHVIGTDPIVWSQVSGKAVLIPGNGLEITNNTLTLPSIAQSNTASTSGSSNFVQNVSVDSYGRLVGVTTNDVLIALGTNTTGDYVASISASVGTGITVSGAGEAAVVEVSSNATPNNTANTIVMRDENGHFSAGLVTAELSGNALTANTFFTPRTIGLTGDLSGSVSFDGSQDVAIAATIEPNSVALGTDTSGDYVSSLVAGTGITLTNNSGETATPTIAIGQAVETSSSVTFANVTADLVGNVTGNVIGSINGNAGSATVLQTARNIAGQLFNGSADISIAPTDLTGVTATASEINTLDGITASTAELNVLDGITASVAELNILDGVTSSAAELNILDGVTSSAAELNILDGATLSTVELNYVDGVTSAIQTQIDAKAPSASPTFTGVVTLPDNTVALGTKTTGDYVASLVAGTGVTLTNNSGETATPTVAIGQAVGTSASVTFADITVTGILALAGDPASALHAATKEYVDNVASGVVAKPSVLGATTTNIDATYANGTLGVGGTLTANSNGVFPSDFGGASGWAVGKGILVKNQTNKEENGRYFVSDMGSVSTPYVLTRCSYCDEASEIPGAYIFVQDGTLAGTGWIQIVADPATFVVGTDDIDVFQFSGAGTLLGGNGLVLTDNTFNVGTADVSRIVVNADDIDLATTGVSAGAYNSVSVDVYGRVTSASVASYVATSDTGTVTSTMIADGTIVDADINASAAIALSKLATSTAGNIIVYNASGVPTSVTETGDVTISDTGVTAIASGVIVNADVSASAAIDLGKLADVSTNAQAASYTLVLADKNKVVEMGVGSANNLTVPLNSSVAFPVGAQINILQTGTGQTTVVAAGGVTINATPGLKMRAQWSYATLIKRATDTWVLVGDISA